MSERSWESGEEEVVADAERDAQSSEEDEPWAAEHTPPAPAPPFDPIGFHNAWTQLMETDLSQALAKLEEERASGVGVEKRGCCGSTLRCGPCGRPRLEGAVEGERERLLALTRVPYSDSEALHWRMLGSLWSLCRPSEGAPRRRGEHWETIGFQGSDPATDFRGVGVLGLAQLLALAEDLHADDLRDLLALSNCKPQTFPMSAVGLNFSKFITTAIKRDRLNALIMAKSSVVEAANGVYRGAFVLFYRLWSSGKCSIEDFARISAKVEKEINRRPAKLLSLRRLSPHEALDKVAFDAAKETADLPKFSDIVENTL